MHYGDDNTTIDDIDHEQRMDAETRDIVWQAFMDWAREGNPFTIAMQAERLRHGAIDPYYGQVQERLTEFLRWHKESDLFYALAQIQREREREAA